MNLNWSLLQSRESAELVGGLAAALEAVAAASADYEPEGISGVDRSGLAEGAESIQKSRLAVLTNVNPSPHCQIGYAKLLLSSTPIKLLIINVF